MKHLLFISLILLSSKSFTQQNFNLNNKSLTSLTFVDIDNDGDLDAFGVGYGMSAGKVFYHKNSGTKEKPVFELSENTPYGLSIKSLSALTFVDIDNDGDFDAFGVGYGMSAGRVFYHKNSGTKEKPVFELPENKPFGLITKSLSSLTFVDIDNDGDFDAFGVGYGMSAGTIFYHKNSGTKEKPVFELSENTPFGLITKSLSSLTFVDIDNDGDFDAFGVGYGMSAGRVFYHKNSGTKEKPVFELSENKPFGLSTKSLSSLTFVDIDNDGDFEAFGVGYGMSAGTVFTSVIKE